MRKILKRLRLSLSRPIHPPDDSRLGPEARPARVPILATGVEAGFATLSATPSSAPAADEWDFPRPEVRESRWSDEELPPAPEENPPEEARKHFAPWRPRVGQGGVEVCMPLGRQHGTKHIQWMGWSRGLGFVQARADVDEAGEPPAEWHPIPAEKAVGWLFAQPVGGPHAEWRERIWEGRRRAFLDAMTGGMGDVVLAWDSSSGGVPGQNLLAGLAWAGGDCPEGDPEGVQARRQARAGVARNLPALLCLFHPHDGGPSLSPSLIDSGENIIAHAAQALKMPESMVRCVARLSREPHSWFQSPLRGLWKFSTTRHRRALLEILADRHFGLDGHPSPRLLETVSCLLREFEKVFFQAMSRTSPEEWARQCLTDLRLPHPSRDHAGWSARRWQAFEAWGSEPWSGKGNPLLSEMAGGAARLGVLCRDIVRVSKRQGVSPSRMFAVLSAFAGLGMDRLLVASPRHETLRVARMRAWGQSRGMDVALPSPHDPRFEHFAPEWSLLRESLGLSEPSLADFLRSRAAGSEHGGEMEEAARECLRHHMG